MWVLKTIVTILGEIIASYHKLQGILLLLINVGLLWVVVRNVPYYNATINCFQGALYTLLTWQAMILFALVWNDSWAEVCIVIFGFQWQLCVCISAHTASYSYTVRTSAAWHCRVAGRHAMCMVCLADNEHSHGFGSVQRLSQLTFVLMSTDLM